MGTYYYVLFAIFIVLALMIVIDQNVGDYIVLILKIIQVKFDTWKWWLLNNPRNPIVKYLMWRRAYRLAEELQIEIENKK